jgi:hypothetical protein
MNYFHYQLYNFFKNKAGVSIAPQKSVLKGREKEILKSFGYL